MSISGLAAEAAKAGTTRAACESAAVETATSTGACAAMEYISEDIAEHIVHIAALEMELLIAAAVAGVEAAATEASLTAKALAARSSVETASCVCPGVACLVEGRKAELII